MDGATVVIRDGFIQAVGRDVAPPADARVWEMNGLTIYAGFIDPFLKLESTNPPVNSAKIELDSQATAGGVKFFAVAGGERDRSGPGYEVAQVLSQDRVAGRLAADKR